MPPTRASPPLLLLLLLLLLPVLLPLPRVASAARLSFEACTSSQECASDYSCNTFDSDLGTLTTICSSVLHSDPESDPPPCFCQPLPSIRSCASEDDCPPYEVCARTLASPSSPLLCYSCTLLSDSLVTPLNPSTSVCKALPTRTPLPSSTPHPTSLPSGGAFDVCSFPATNLAASCAHSSICLDVDFAADCTFITPHCHCLPINRESCVSSDECDVDHVCALHVRTHQRLCTSCSALVQHVDLLPDDSDSAVQLCPNSSSSPSLLQHLPAPNGLTRDRCLTPEMCIGNRQCISPEVDALCTSFSIDQCHCRPWDGMSTDQVRNCTTSAVCGPGEVCASYLTEASPICMSADVARAFRTVFDLRIYHEQLATPWRIPKSTKLSGDPCQYDRDCTSPRRCSHVAERRYGSCAGRRACVCRPWTKTPCERSVDCDTGERCFNFPDALSRPFCWSDDAARRDGLVVVEEVEEEEEEEEDDDDDEADGSVEPSVEAGEWAGETLVGETCRWHSDCRQGAACRHVSEDVARCGGRRFCVCDNMDWDSECITDADCVSGEKCVVLKDAMERLRVGRCRSESVIENDPLSLYETRPTPSSTSSPTPSPLPKSATPSPFPRTSSGSGNPSANDGDVCMDVALLRDLPERHRVFATARQAVVLCDASGSCATAGHVVEWLGEIMRMHTYCEREDVICNRAVMWVNSPSMARGLRVETFTKGLRFTALAARWNSAVEERLIRLLLRTGLF